MPKDEDTAFPATAAGDPNPCCGCNAYEVDGFARSQMARSMRVRGQEPAGVVRTAQAAITMHAGQDGSWQTLKSGSTSTTYHVDIRNQLGGPCEWLHRGPGRLPLPVAGSLTIAAGQSMVWLRDMKEGGVGVGCLSYRAGTLDAVAGTENRYAPVPFPQLAIGCNRCHGPTALHLANPQAPNTIVNPALLKPATRDSVCEQCHLKGAARV